MAARFNASKIDFFLMTDPPLRAPNVAAATLLGAIEQPARRAYRTTG
jgi:hypothetical protein